MTAVERLVFAYNGLVLAYFLLVNLTYGVLIYWAAREARNHVRRGRMERVDELMRSPLAPGVSIVVPAFDEEVGIVDAVRALLALRYPRFQVLVVSDGSTDATLERLSEAFSLEPFPRVYVPSIPTQPVRAILRSRSEPRLLVVDKENGGKADALNCGINLADEELVCSVDADAILDRDALLHSCRPFVDDPERVVAAGGIVRIGNGCRIDRGHVDAIELPGSRLASIQVVEYLRAFLAARSGWSRMNALLIISGAFGIFRRDLLRAVGGYSTQTVGEDGELVVRLHRAMLERRRPYRITFVPEPVCWTEGPETLGQLRRQRTRWHRGLAEILWTHRRMICNPRYGRVGMLALPVLVALELLGPLVELSGLAAVVAGWQMGILSTAFAAAFGAVAFSFGLLLSVSALVLDESSQRRYPRLPQLARLLAYGFVEQLGYRQLLAAWRVWAMLELARGRRGWGEMRRRGLARA